MLMEIAEEDGHREFAESLATVREAGIELTHLLQDKRLITLDPQPDREYWPLSDAVRDGINRVLGFTDTMLDGTKGRSPRHLSGRSWKNPLCRTPFSRAFQLERTAHLPRKRPALGQPGPHRPLQWKHRAGQRERPHIDRG